MITLLLELVGEAMIRRSVSREEAYYFLISANFSVAIDGEVISFV